MDFVPSADGTYCVACGVNILTNEIMSGEDGRWEWTAESDTFVLFADTPWGRQAKQTAVLHRDTDPVPGDTDPVPASCFGCDATYG